MVLYNFHQNRIFKQVNYTFKGKLQSMILDSNISKQFWLLRFSWSIQLKNCLPTSTLPDYIFFQALSEKLLDLIHL